MVHIFDFYHFQNLASVWIWWQQNKVMTKHYTNFSKSIHFQFNSHL